MGRALTPSPELGLRLSCFRLHGSTKPLRLEEGFLTRQPARPSLFGERGRKGNYKHASNAPISPSSGLWSRSRSKTNPEFRVVRSSNWQNWSSSLKPLISSLSVQPLSARLDS